MFDSSKREFNNKWCKQCFADTIAKYGKFDINCKGIDVDNDIKRAIRAGISEHDAKFMFDPRYFFEIVYQHKPREYQELVLLCSSTHLTARQCRQSGKTLTIIFKIMHYIITNDNKTVLIVAPNEKVVKKIFDEYIIRDCINKNTEIRESVISKTQKPYFQVELCNGSKVILMIAGPGTRSQSSNWLYIDEAALVPESVMNDIVMTTGSKGDDAVYIQTSTPKGRGNIFYKACKEDTSYKEFHVPITQIDAMRGQIPKFLKALGQTGFDQECMAEFNTVGGSIFNYKGIDYSKHDYEYDHTQRENGVIYTCGVDWNGASNGTYMYVCAFDPSSYTFKIVDKKVVSSVEWNSLAAKQALIDLNRKWQLKHILTDFGFSNSIIEEIKAYSMKVTANVGTLHADSQLKHVIETVDFGNLITIQDPFTKEELQKTTTTFIMSQVARLFEPKENNNTVISISQHDSELITSLESYQLIGSTARGFEKYGMAKGSGVEDHAIVAFALSVYAIIKYYNELFRRIIYMSSTFSTESIHSKNNQEVVDLRGKDVLLLSDNDKTPIEKDERMFEHIPRSNTFSRSGHIRRTNFSQDTFRNRSNIIRRTLM